MWCGCGDVDPESIPDALVEILNGRHPGLDPWQQLEAAIEYIFCGEGTEEQERRLGEYCSVQFGTSTTGSDTETCGDIKAGGGRAEVSPKSRRPLARTAGKRAVSATRPEEPATVQTGEGLSASTRVGPGGLSSDALAAILSNCAPPVDPGPLGWQELALCAQTDPEAFFPEKGGSTREAKRVCEGCEVRVECLDYALKNDERFGIWGGYSERERRRMKPRRDPRSLKAKQTTYKPPKPPTQRELRYQQLQSQLTELFGEDYDLEPAAIAYVKVAMHAIGRYAGHRMRVTEAKRIAATAALLECGGNVKQAGVAASTEPTSLDSIIKIQVERVSKLLSEEPCFDASGYYQDAMADIAAKAMVTVG